MNFPNFVGPSYTGYSVNAASEKLVNLYPEIQESPGAKARTVLYGTPGISLFTTLANGGNRALYRCTFGGSERVFSVGGNSLYEVFSGGTNTLRGAMATDGLPVSVNYNGRQLMLTTNNQGWIFDLSSNTLVQITDPDFPGSSMAVATDNYYVALKPDSQEFYISALLDGLEWDALDFASNEAKPDRTISLLADHGELWFFGEESVQPYQNTGAPDFPFEPIPGSFIEHGCVAKDSPAKFDNSILWLGGDSRGSGVVWRADGYTPQRVSTHAVENALRGYSTISDAVAYVYLENGHWFYVLSFPAAQTTWVYDASTNLWHERQFWNKATGQFEAHPCRTHVFAFGKHLVGNRVNGEIYEASLNTYYDAGNEIRRIRRAPHLHADGKRIFFHRLQIFTEAGVGLDGASSVQGTNPQMMLRWSNDGGHTFGNEHWRPMGKLGKYKTRTDWNQLGESRDRVFEAMCSEPIKQAWTHADIDFTVGVS